MYIILFFLIALCDYTSTAGNDQTSDTPINLDVNTREETDRVNVTKKEDGNMVIYKIEPKSGYKIDKFVDGEEIINSPQFNIEFSCLEVKCPKATDESMLVSLIYQKPCCGRGKFNYICYKGKWVSIADKLYKTINNRMKSEQSLSREVVEQEYVKTHKANGKENK